MKGKMKTRGFFSCDAECFENLGFGGEMVSQGWGSKQGDKAGDEYWGLQH